MNRKEILALPSMPAASPSYPMGPYRFINREYFNRAHAFFEKYGGKAVVIGRFVPIIRTFVPFVAGAVAMTYPRFAFFNVTGALLWVGVCVGGGYAFGNVPLVQRNFSLVVLGIIAVSLMPIAIEFVQARARARRRAGASATSEELGA